MKNEDAGIKALTSRQQEVLMFVAGFIKEHSYPPTVREIAAHFSISVKGAYDHITVLKRKKRLKANDRGARTLELVVADDSYDPAGLREIPILGDVAAGKSIFSEENKNGVICIHNAMFKRNAQYFALNVRGDSMNGIGVLDGDTVIIEQRETAKNGDVVVVDVDDGGRALKRFFRQSNRIKLISENPAYPPLYSTDVRILGRLAGVYRVYENTGTMREGK